MKALQELAAERRLLIIGDSKLISYANLAAMSGQGVTFVAPASKTYVPAGELGLTLDAATEVDYAAQRALHPRPGRGHRPRQEARPGPRGPPAARARPRVASLPDRGQGQRRLAVITAGRRAGACLQAQAGTDPGTGRPTLAWAFDQQAIDAEAATDGWYALLSNLPASEAGAAGVLVLYKGRKQSSAAVPRSRAPSPSPRSS